MPASVLVGSPDYANDLLVVLGDPLSPGFNATQDVQALSLNLGANNAIPQVQQFNTDWAGEPLAVAAEVNFRRPPGDSV